jgi:hypothetical protein
MPREKLQDAVCSTLARSTSLYAAEDVREVPKVLGQHNQERL